MGPHERGIARCTMRSFGGELTRYEKKPYRTASLMNAIPTNVSTPKTATSTNTNTMPKAIIRCFIGSRLKAVRYPQ